MEININEEENKLNLSNISFDDNKKDTIQDYENELDKVMKNYTYSLDSRKQSEKERLSAKKLKLR